MFSKIFGVPTVNFEDNKYFKIRRDNGFFIDPKNNATFARNGWVIIKQLVGDEDLFILESALKKILQEKLLVLDENFLNSGCIPSFDLKLITRQAIEEFAPILFHKIFYSNVVEFKTGGSFVIKPPAKSSALELHQDGSFVDEEKDYSMFLWIPFSDVNEENGCLKVLNGSHLWGNTQRGFGTEWKLKEHIELLKNHLTTISIKRGDVLVFDPALIHGSEANLSKKVRNAITISVVKKNQQLIHYFKDNENDEIKMYMVDNDFFDKEDFMTQPDDLKWKFKTVQYKGFKKTRREVIRFIHSYK